MKSIYNGTSEGNEPLFDTWGANCEPYIYFKIIFYKFIKICIWCFLYQAAKTSEILTIFEKKNYSCNETGEIIAKRRRKASITAIL